MGKILDVWCAICTDLQGIAVASALTGIVCGTLRLHWLAGGRR